MQHNLSVGGLLAAAIALQSPICAQFLPDLTTYTCSVSPGIARPGQAVVVSYDVRNIGQWGTAVTWEDRILFNTVRSPGNASVLRPDLPCKYFPNYLLPGQTYSQFGANPSIQVTLPTGLASGIYYIGYQCCPNGGRGDRCGGPWTFPESTTANNVCWTPIQIDGIPDFVITSVSANPTRWQAGVSVTLSATVANQGGNSANGSIYVDFFLSSTSAPSGNPIARAGPILVSGGHSLPVQANISAPAVPNGCYYVVAFADSSRSVAESSEANNTNSTPIVFSPAPNVTPFGQGCPGSLGPLGLSANGLPTLGNGGFEIQVSNIPQLLVGLLTGLSNTAWAGGTLPFDLSRIGMTGCELLVSAEFTWAKVANPSHRAVFPLSIPPSPAILGASFFVQAAAQDFGVNTLGVIASNALECTVGK